MAVDIMDPAQQYEANLLSKMKPLNEVTSHGTSPVQQFYNGTTVFLTGGSGFLGKHLIEKLIRATNISKIFMLLRSKKGKSIEQRLTEILKDPLYDLLRKQQPDFADKLMPVSGDVSELRLGLSEKDWNTISEQVDIIFHLAATTRFDESLRNATLINIRGTRETIKLCQACKDLRSFIYVSTAFSQACADRINGEVFEKFYKSAIDPNTMIELAETVDEERINGITPSLINNWPNTYTFTKSIAEELVNTIGNDLPKCVVRPAIVACSKLEPTPGWVDMSCMYGASGMFALGALGVIHTCYINLKSCLDIIPVDYVNNVIIAAGWETAKRRELGENKTKIYVVSPSSRNPVTAGTLVEILDKEVRTYPSQAMVGYAYSLYTTNPIIFWICSWLFHIIPAYIIDAISVLLGNKRRFVKLATKMYRMLCALSYFNLHQWKFEDQNTVDLFVSLSKEDQVIFNFDVENIDWVEFMVTWSIGLRKYIVKDGLTGTIAARRKQKMLKIATYVIVPLYFYCLYRSLCFVLTLFSVLCKL